MLKDKTKALLKLTLASTLALGIFSTYSDTDYVEASSHSVERIEGNNRFETAALISSESYTSSDTVIITDAREFADALAGVPLAYSKKAPILLVQGNGLRDSILNEINRLGATEAII